MKKGNVIYAKLFTFNTSVAFTGLKMSIEEESSFSLSIVYKRGHSTYSCVQILEFGYGGTVIVLQWLS